MGGEAIEARKLPIITKSYIDHGSSALKGMPCVPLKPSVNCRLAARKTRGVVRCLKSSGSGEHDYCSQMVFWETNSSRVGFMGASSAWTNASKCSGDMTV